MSESETSLIIGAIAMAIASVVYSMKHIKKSECCGSTCTQVVLDSPPTPIIQLENPVPKVSQI